MFVPHPELERLALTQHQGQRWRALLAEILPRHAFYARKFASAQVQPQHVPAPVDLVWLPVTTKAELLADQKAHPPYGSLLTYPRSAYTRLHQSSGTSTGQPLRWLDTPASWQWLLHCWQQSFQLVGLRTDDRLFFPFSFGPFLGFWSAFEAATHAGYFCLPGGGLSSPARLRLLLENDCTVLFATPTYALHLVEVARTERIDLAQSPIRLVIVAGEPGGSIPATRALIEAGWGARVIDHHGLTEVGPIGVECPAEPRTLQVLETEYLVEVLDPGKLSPTPVGQVGELVVTNLGRWGSPLIRYRTGDLVQAGPIPARGGRRFVGGVLGRADDMLHVRGNNVYPAALEAVVRRFAEVAEFRIIVDQTGAMTELLVQLEPTPTASPELAERVQQALRDELLFRIDVTTVAVGSLPRFEMKAKRVEYRR